jgi:hypothetical protein
MKGRTNRGHHWDSHVTHCAFVFVVLGTFLVVGCSDPKPRESEQKACVEPLNPYDEGTGHYAGYNWAEEKGGGCNGNSASFNEGCEEYHSQEDEYEACEAQQQNR